MSSIILSPWPRKWASLTRISSIFIYVIASSLSVNPSGRHIKTAKTYVPVSRPVFFCALLLLFCLRIADVYADLSPTQTKRLKACRLLLKDVDPRPFPAVEKDLKKSGHLEESLRVLEAVARTYAAIARDKGVTKQQSREWLYSMVRLNMAFLQLGGDEHNVGGGKDRPLNRLICRKLKENLPSDLLHQHSGVFHSTDEWSE